MLFDNCIGSASQDYFTTGARRITNSKKQKSF